MTNSSKEQAQLPPNLLAGMFKEGTFSGMDALVAFIPKGQDTPSEVKQTVDDAGAGRWYPSEGGWKIVCPYTGQGFNPDLFTVEEGGWRHEHCYICESMIGVGDRCWVAETQEEDYLICGNCHQKLETRDGGSA